MFFEVDKNLQRGVSCESACECERVGVCESACECERVGVCESACVRERKREQTKGETEKEFHVSEAGADINMI